MTETPDRREQIRLVHAQFIRQLADACRLQSPGAELEGLLRTAEEGGWSDLVRAIRKIAGGARGPSVLAGLDEEDQVIAESVLLGLKDPSTLPDPQAKPGAALAAPGLAGMIRAAATGNTQALVLVGNMAEQMSRFGGPMARLAAVIRPLINGERDADRLCANMDAAGRQLVLDILGELGRLERH